MDIAGRRHPETALKRRAEIRDDVAEQVVRHDDLELARVEHQVHGERVDVVVGRRDRRILRRDLPEDALPERVALGHRVALVGHADPGQAARLRELERVADDAMHALVGVQLFLNRNLVLGARLEPAADAHVQALGVLPEHDEIDVARCTSLQWAQTFVEQADGTVVHVEIELEARPEQDVARVSVVGHARIAERSDEHRVELAQQIVSVGRNRDAGLQVVIGAPRQVFEIEAAAEPLADRAEHLDGLGGDLLPDAVTRNDCEAHACLRHSRAPSPCPCRR